MIEGMRLRPVVEADLEVLDAAFNDEDAIGVFNWGGFIDMTVWRRRWAENRLLTEEKSVLMIDVGEETVGFVNWGRNMTGPIGYCYEYGISLWPSARGKGYGTAAQLLLARYLFAHSPVHRIQATTDIDNIGEQRALEKAGFIREAVLKELAFRDGRWRDQVVYRMLRTELPPVSS